MTPSPRLLARLGEPDCKNYIAVSNEFIKYNERFEKIQFNNYLAALLYNPIYEIKAEYAIIDFKPV